MNPDIDILLDSDLYKPTTSLTEFVKLDDFCFKFLEEANQKNVYHVDINTLLHIYLYNRKQKHSAEMLLNRIIEHFNRE